MSIPYLYASSDLFAVRESTPQARIVRYTLSPAGLAATQTRTALSQLRSLPDGRLVIYRERASTSKCTE